MQSPFWDGERRDPNRTAKMRVLARRFCLGGCPGTHPTEGFAAQASPGINALKFA
jgi:hypothetical protein